MYKYLLLLASLSSMSFAQSELLLERLTYSSDNVFVHDLGRLRADGFLVVDSSNEAYAAGQDVAEVKAVSGKVIVGAGIWDLVERTNPNALTNYKHSMETYQPFSAPSNTNGVKTLYYIIEWDAKVPPVIVSTGRLVNLSTRSTVATGGAAIAGFIISDGPAKVLIRAVGPGLKPFGVSNVMLNPTMDVFAQSVAIAQNDDWSSSPENQQVVSDTSAAAGGFPLDVLDAAVVLTLNPGAYTAVVRGKNGEGGEVLVEVYLAP